MVPIHRKWYALYDTRLPSKESSVTRTQPSTRYTFTLDLFTGDLPAVPTTLGRLPPGLTDDNGTTFSLASPSLTLLDPPLSTTFFAVPTLPLADTESPTAAAFVLSTKTGFDI